VSRNEHDRDLPTLRPHCRCGLKTVYYRHRKVDNHANDSTPLGRQSQPDGPGTQPDGTHRPLASRSTINAHDFRAIKTGVLRIACQKWCGAF
jgi:hypothetical protein